MKSSRAGLYALIGLMTFIWGINYVAAKISLRYFPPLLFAPLRTVFATAFLLPIYILAKRRKPDSAPWTRSEILTLAALGVVGITLNQVFFIIGISMTSVAHAALIISIGPVFVLILAALRGQEQLTGRKSAGMAVAILGVAALQFAPGRSTGASVKGDLLVLLASFLFAVFTIFGKEATLRHDAVTVNTIGYAAGALAGLPVLLWAARSFDFSSASAAGWGMLVYMALFPSVSVPPLRKTPYLLDHRTPPSQTSLSEFSIESPRSRLPFATQCLISKASESKMSKPRLPFSQRTHSARQ